MVNAGRPFVTFKERVHAAVEERHTSIDGTVCSDFVYWYSLIELEVNIFNIVPLSLINVFLFRVLQEDRGQSEEVVQGFWRIWPRWRIWRKHDDDAQTGSPAHRRPSVQGPQQELLRCHRHSRNVVHQRYCVTVACKARSYHKIVLICYYYFKATSKKEETTPLLVSSLASKCG